MEQSQETTILSSGFLAALVVVCVFVFAVVVRLAPSSASAAPNELSQVELHALARQATLRVSSSACGRTVRGSGLIIDGYLVTNAHLVDGATQAKADQPIDPVLVDVAHVDLASDLALAERPAGVSLVLASDTSVEGTNVAGTEVLLAGHADGGAIELQPGRVSARVPGGAYGYGVDVLLIDAETRGGYSGGPVLDDTGNVVAVLSGFDRTTGLTIAIPADVVRDVLSSPSGPGAADAPVVASCGTG